MSFSDTSVIYRRYNDAAYDLAKAGQAISKGDLQNFDKHTRDAGEALSQTIEFALKHHLNKHLSSVANYRFDLRGRNLPQLIEKYELPDGSAGEFKYHTVEDTISPSVNFSILRDTKRAITNSAKHEGKKNDFELQKTYLGEINKFIHQYIDKKIKLKTIQDFEAVDLSSWDTFYTACDRFRTDERTYILVTGPVNFRREHWAHFNIPKWDLIIDFDYNSLNEGLYSTAFKNNELPPHIIKAADPIDTNSFSRHSIVHYHYFPNNYLGSGKDEVRQYKEWVNRAGRNTQYLLESFAEVMGNQKTIVVILYPAKPYVNFVCEKIIQNFGENTHFVFANDREEILHGIASDYDGTYVNITMPQIADGLATISSNFGKLNALTGKYQIPYNQESETENVTGVMSAETFAQYEECFEVLHLGLPQPGENETRQTFLSGERRISFFGLKQRFDVVRESVLKRSVKQVRKQLDTGRGKIQLLHDPGFGGTTFARRLAWELHFEYPTVVLKKYRDQKVKEKLVDLHQRTRKSILVVMEVPQAITFDEVELLYRQITQARPIIFLIVSRGRPTVSNAANSINVTDWGNDINELIDVYKPYLSEYTNASIRRDKERELNSIINSSESYKKTPFFIGLLTFEEKFFALREYIKNFLNQIQNKEPQKKALLYLALCYDYLGKGIPNSFFKKLFKVEKDKIFYLEKYIDSPVVDSLLSSTEEGNQRVWQIRHQFFSREIKRQILSGNSENPEIWKQSLADYCVKFIEDSQSDSFSESIQELLKLLFIGNRRDRTAGEKFTTVIEELPNVDDKEKVFVALKNNYPDNPHYCSHLARFYAYHNKNRDKALKYADEAIYLSEIQGIQDPLLYHIKGMCLRSAVYELMEKHRRQKLRKELVREDEYDNIIEVLVPTAANEFQLSREIAKKQNRLDEYGYIAHIQLLVKAIDYAIVISGLSKADFFVSKPEPFGEWLDLAESLLDEVRRINQDDDESGKIAECDDEILAFYENYQQILQNLRAQLDKGKHPTRVRRQIARTYFRMKGLVDTKVISNIMELMEQNIESEPENERNYFLWFQAARNSKITLSDALGKMSRWKSNSNALDAVYYFYIFKVLRALEGYSDAVVDAFDLIKECRSKGKANITIYEWLGKGQGLNKIVNRNDFSPETKEDKLQFVSGFFTEYLHDGNGKITIADKLEVYFSPIQAKLTSNDVNKEVEFYLGFSYDGLRADSFSVRLKGDQATLQSGNSAKAKVDSSIRVQVLEKLLTGTVIDLQKPPHYVMGRVKTQEGKIFFFHKNNENPIVFKQLSIGTSVTFELMKSERGTIAARLKLLEPEDN